MSDSTICKTRLVLMEEATRYREQARREASDEVKIHWECGRGHIWDKALDFNQNVRCMNCAAERRELETRRLRELAQVRGGALLSHGYVDVTTPLCWKCAYGHVWEARPDTASRHWCAQCARTVFAAYR